MNLQKVHLYFKHHLSVTTKLRWKIPITILGWLAGHVVDKKSFQLSDAAPFHEILIKNCIAVKFLKKI